MDWPTLIPLAALLLATGAIAGVIAGLLGVGGGIILVPAFLFVFGQLGFASDALMQICLATSLATIVVTSIRSLSKHRAQGAVDLDILKTWAPGIVVGAGAGVVLANLLDTETLKLIFGALVLLVGLWITFGRTSWRIADTMPTGPLRALLSVMVGVLSTLMGIGGGSFGVPLMTLYGRSVHAAVATAAGFGLLIAVPSVIGFLLSPVPSEVRPPLTVGSVNLIAFALVVIMTWLTAPLGVRLAHRLDPGPLKRIFGLFLLAVALRMLWSALA
jgi:uncharacterized membrane protein YfcA